MKTPSDQKLSKRLDHLVQQAIDKAIKNHRQKGESIAISDEQGKVKIIPASEVYKLKQETNGKSN